MASDEQGAYLRRVAGWGTHVDTEIAAYEHGGEEDLEAQSHWAPPSVVQLSKQEKANFTTMHLHIHLCRHSTSSKAMLYNVT